jgi:hypothetical protein
MSDPVIVEVVPETKEAQTIVIPASISIPDTRVAPPSGTLVKGDILTIVGTLVDKDGNPKKFGEADGLKIIIPDAGEGKEYLGVLYLNFVISNIPPVTAEPEPPIIEHDQV